MLCYHQDQKRSNTVRILAAPTKSPKLGAIENKATKPVIFPVTQLTNLKAINVAFDASYAYRALLLFSVYTLILVGGTCAAFPYVVHLV